MLVALLTLRRWAAGLCCFALLVLGTPGHLLAQPALPPAPSPTDPPPAAEPAPSDAAPAVPDAPGAPAGDADSDSDSAGGLPPSTAVVPRLPPGEGEQARGQVLSEIHVPGNRRISTRDVRSYLRERVGETFQPEELTADVRELYNSGFFDDIQVDLKRVDAGVVLRFFVRERPNIAKVVFEGNVSIESEDLTETIETKENTILSRPAIQRGSPRLRDMYAERGYSLADAASELAPERGNERTVKCKVPARGQVSVRRVAFIGNEAIATSELRASMFTGTGGFFAFGSGG